jgi:hypothetical protein
MGAHLFYWGQGDETEVSAAPGVGVKAVGSKVRPAAKTFGEQQSTFMMRCSYGGAVPVHSGLGNPASRKREPQMPDFPGAMMPLGSRAFLIVSLNRR